MKKLFLTTVLLLSGCGYNKWSGPITSFSATAPATFDSVSLSYTTSNNIHLMKQEAILVQQYNSMNFHPGQITNFISDNDLIVRINSINSLKSYSTSLESIINPSVSIPALPSVVAGSTISTSQKTNLQELQIAASQLNNITIEIIHTKEHRNLPKIIKSADPLLQKFAILFVLDLTDIKQQEKNDYDALLIYQNQFMQDNQNSMTPIEKRTEIEKLVQLEKDSLSSQSILNNTINSVQQMAKMHHQLSEAN